MADRRLRQIELLAGAADAAFAVDRFEDDEQVEIELRDIRHIDGFICQIFIFVMARPPLA